MKNRFRHKITSITLALMMAAAPVGGSVFAATDFEAAQPDKPVAESFEDNSKIEEYNKKVDDYNKSAKEYNESVDKEHEAAVAETAAKNAEIEQHNAAELERVAAAEQRNAEAVAEAEAANAQIEKENAEEEARVNKHNEEEAAKVEASRIEKEAAEKKNEEITAHNEAVAKYAEDKAAYDKAKAQYDYDVVMEQKILAAGYASVEQYNDRINKAYNEPAKKSVEMNAKSTLDDVSKTYSVKEASEKSGVNVKVNVKHVFEGTDISFSKEFTIDANDTITLNSIGALGSATNPGYATFYFNTDEDHSIGYWCESWSCLETTARHCEYGWNCGDEHEISYSEGKSHANDEEVIDMTYYYMWMPLRTAKTYNTPVAPTELVNPGEAKELVEVPEIYTPNYKTFVKKEHVAAVTEEIAAANILEAIEAPVKKAYIELLSYMALFEEPEEIIPAAENNDPAGQEAQARTSVSQSAGRTAQTTVIADNETPMAEFAMEGTEADGAIIADAEAPLAAPAGNWALINLICTVLAVIGAAAALFRRKEDEEAESDEDNRDRNMMIAKIAGAAAAIASLIAFFITEDMSLSMVLADKWTLLMAALFAVQIASAAGNRKAAESRDNDEMPEAINA